MEGAPNVRGRPALLLASARAVRGADFDESLLTTEPVAHSADAAEMPRRRFVGFLALLIPFSALLIYLSTPLMPLTADEFEQAHEIVRALRQRLYEDFVPRTNVLLHLVAGPVFDPALSSQPAAVAAKLLLGSAWIGVLLLVPVLLRRVASPWAIVLALALLCTHGTFIQRCSELRAETLAAAFAAAVLLALQTRRLALAGACLALSILASQFALLLSLVAIAALALGSIGRDRAIGAVDWRRFLAGLSAPLLGYVALFWRSAPTVLGSILVMPPFRSLDAIYPGNRPFPYEELAKNGFFWIAAAFAAIWLLALSSAAEPYARVVQRLTATALLVALGMTWLRPSLILFAIPPAFILIVRAIDTVRADSFDVARRFVTAGVLAYVLLGLFVPLSNLPRVPRTGMSTFQKYMMNLADRLLMPGDSYFAGVDVLYARDQVGATVLAAAQAGGRLGIVELDPAAETELNRALRAAPPKLVLISTMLDRAPRSIQSFVEANYSRYHGCIFLYGPKVAGDRFAVHFPGRYTVLAKRGKLVEIDGREFHLDDEVELAAGEHRAGGEVEFRLRFVPDASRLMARFGTPKFLELLPDVYDRNPELLFDRDRILLAEQLKAPPTELSP